MNKLLQKLEERKKENSCRRLSVNTGLIDFFSNDYLGLARSRELYEMTSAEMQKLSGNLNGSTGSRLLSGNSSYFEATERKLAQLFQAESALLFNSGYYANVSILSAVPQKGDTILYDELIHASLKEGARLSFAKRYSFRHNDLQDLEQKIKKAEGDCYVTIESVYSMDGDFAPLEDIISLCEKYNAFLILDEAHSTGIWGQGGSGIACAHGLEQRIFARVYTFGKAMGIHGACIAGSQMLIEFLINFARPFIYTTALPPHAVASVNAAFDYIAKDERQKNTLLDRIAFFKKQVQQSDKISTMLIESQSGVQALKVPGNTAARMLAEKMVQTGFDLRAILSPTVKEGEERLRICIHSYNSEEEIERLVKHLKEFI